MRFPFRLNITMIVKSKAMRVSGLILGMSLVLYHSFPFAFTRTSLVTRPARKGMPR
jgi:hypothetical protein